MEFCPKCNNILDISRTPTKVTVVDPTTISQTTSDNIRKEDDDYLKIINMYKKYYNRWVWKYSRFKNQ